MKKYILALTGLMFASSSFAYELVPVANNTRFEICVISNSAGASPIPAGETIAVAQGSLTAFVPNGPCSSVVYPISAHKSCINVTKSAKIVGANPRHLQLICK